MVSVTYAFTTQVQGDGCWPLFICSRDGLAQSFDYSPSSYSVCVCVTEMACRLRSYIPTNIIIITAGLGLMMRHESTSSCYPPVRLFFISFSFCFQDTQMQVYSRSGWLHPSFPVMCVCIIYSHTDNREKVKKTGAAHRSSLVVADRLK